MLKCSGRNRQKQEPQERGWEHLRALKRKWCPLRTVLEIYLLLKDTQVTHPTPILMCGSAVTREGHRYIQFCKKRLLKIKFNSWHVLEYFLCSKLNTEATHRSAVLAKYSKGNEPACRRPIWTASNSQCQAEKPSMIQHHWTCFSQAGQSYSATASQSSAHKNSSIDCKARCPLALETSDSAQDNAQLLPWIQSLLDTERLQQRRPLI